MPAENENRAVLVLVVWSRIGDGVQVGKISAEGEKQVVAFCVVANNDTVVADDPDV